MIWQLGHVSKCNWFLKLVTWIFVKSTNNKWMEGPSQSLGKPQGPLVIKSSGLEIFEGFEFLIQGIKKRKRSRKFFD
jgi:hypothetical protein